MPAQFPDGEGIFETILTIEGAPQLLDRHILRAKGSARYLGWDFPEECEIELHINETLSRSRVETRLGRLRIVFSPAGVCVASHDPYVRQSQPARLTLSSSPIDESSNLAGMKTLPYRNNLEILHWANDGGFDDAIRLNGRGEVAETAVANLLMKAENLWFTPPLSTGILPGIIRALAIEFLAIEERVFQLSDLQKVDSIFLLNSLKGFHPVSSLDSHLLQIDSAFMEKVASLPQFSSVG